MFDRPALADAEIARALRAHYGIETPSLEFLALGNDANAWTFRATDVSGDAFFLKVRRSIDPAKLAVAAFVSTHGVEEAVAPVPSIDGELSVNVGGFALIVYPFLEAQVAVEVGLTEAQWVEYGDIVRRLHSVVLPADLAAKIPHEDFVSKWIEVVERVE